MILIREEFLQIGGKLGMPREKFFFAWAPSRLGPLKIGSQDLVKALFPFGGACGFVAHDSIPVLHQDAKLFQSAF